MKKPPRLIADLRRKSIRSQVLCIVACIAAAYGVWRGMEYYSTLLKNEGAAILDAIERERGPRIVDRIVTIRKTFGKAMSCADDALRAGRYAFPGDIRGFAETRKDIDRARECVTQYRTNVERRDEIAEKLKSEIGREGNKSKFENRLNSIAKDNAGTITNVVEELGTATELRKTLEARIVIPWLYFRARDAAKETLRKTQKATLDVAWGRELVSIEEEVQDFSRRIANYVSEMRTCDANATNAVTELSGLPFGGERIITEYLEKLGTVKPTFCKSNAAALEVVKAANGVFFSGLEQETNRVAEAVAAADKLHGVHGSLFVKDNELSSVRSCQKAFMSEASRATNEVSDALDAFHGKIKERCELVTKIDEMCERLRAVPRADEKAVEDVCVDASRLVSEARIANLDETVFATTNRIAVAHAGVKDVAEKVVKMLKSIEGGIPDWTEYARKLTAELSAVKESVQTNRDEVAEWRKEIADMEGESSGELLSRADMLLTESTNVWAELPPKFVCVNGKDAERAKKKVAECQKNVTKLRDKIGKFREDIEGAIRAGKLYTPTYESVKQEWGYYLGLGQDRFDFSLKFESPGRHNVEISAWKSAGQLYLPNKMARSIELKGEVSDVSGTLGAGTLEFGNTVAENERPLLSFSTESSAEYRDFTFKLTLGYRSRSLDHKSTSDWNVRKLNLRLKVDGMEKDMIYKKVSKEVN